MIRNPVFESSMKRRMRSYRAPLLLTLYGVFLIVVCIGALSTLQQPDVSLGNLRAGLETYIYLCVMQFTLIVLVSPSLMAGSIAGERERQTLDLLLCTRVGAFGIVAGKLLSCLCFIALLTVSSLPILAITLFFGGVSLADMLAMLLFLVVTAYACSAIGLFCSAVFKRTVTATVVSYLVIFAVGVGTFIIPLVLQFDQMLKITDSMAQMTTYASSYGMIGTSVSTVTYTAAQRSAQAVSMLPKLMFLNPGVGLFSLLVSQTGLLQNTISNTLGYQGNQLFSVFSALGSIAGINMAVSFVLSTILTALSALFIKPQGLKAKKK